MIPEPTANLGLQEATGLKKPFFRRCQLFFVLLMVAAPGYSQTLEVGLFGGDSYYIGDLNPGTHFKNVQLAYGVLARYNIDTRWSVKINGYRGKIKGNSSSTNFLPDRNLSFESSIFDISAVAEFNFLNYFTGSHKDFISPYIYGGISVFFYDPMANGLSLRDLGTEDRGLRRARFAVLRDAAMPAVLIEAGFMSHPVEGKQILDATYRRKMARAIVGGIASYKRIVER